MTDIRKPERVKPGAPMGGLAGVATRGEATDAEIGLEPGPGEARSQFDEAAESEAIDENIRRLAESRPAAATEEIAPAGMKRVRKPFGSREPRGMWPKIPGFEIRWFNNHPGRVERAIEAGYEHVTDRQGRPVTLTVGVAEYGGGLSGYLMKIPSEFYNEDFAAKQRALNETDAQIMRGRFKGAGDKDQRSYIPKSGMRISAARDPR